MRQLKITQQLTDRSDKSFERYLTEIAKISILITAQEEVELAITIADKKDHYEVEKAIKKLVTANLRFVISVAKQYQNQGVSLPDLINEGNAGLVKAAERFDHTKGFKFISYAVWWIRQSILQALAENSRQIRLPLNKISEQNRIRKLIARVEQQFERPLATDEIIFELAKADFIKNNGFTPSDEEIEGMVYSGSYETTRNLIEVHGKKTTSYDQTVNDDSTTTMIEMLEGNGWDNIDQKMTLGDLQYLIKAMIEKIPFNEKYVLTHFFGLNGETSKSLEEIGENLKLTRERVRQIKEKALRRLKNKSASKILVEYM
mgnify:CR=1 FL=1|jgi:RNA polymerase primary sigma factor